MSVPIEWVEKIFAKLSVNYGMDFLNRYKGIKLVDVKTDWSEELGGLDGAAISFALQSLPDRPPTAQQFRNLCLQAPSAVEVPKLEMPKPNPAMVKLVMERLAQSPISPVDNRAWAKAILRDVEAGVRRTPTVVQMARNALASVGA